MQIKSAYNRLDNWFENLPTVQYVFLSWLLAFSITALILVAFIGNTLINIAMTAAGGATGVAIVMYLMRKVNG